MTTILSAQCPMWCTGAHTPDPLAPDARRHRSLGTTVSMSSGSGEQVRVLLDRTDFPPEPGEWDPFPLMIFEMQGRWPEPANACCAAVSVGAGLRFGRLLRVAADELAVETMFGEASDDEPDFAFMVKGRGRESCAPPLAVERHPVRGVPVARLRLGDTRYGGVEVVAGLADLRQLVTAIDCEAAGHTDAGTL